MPATHTAPARTDVPATPVHPAAKPRLQAYLVHVGNNLRFYRLVAKLTTQMRDLAASLDEFSRLDSDDFVPDHSGGEYSATSGMVYDVCEEEMHGLNWVLRHAMDSVESVLLKREEELAGLVRQLKKKANGRGCVNDYAAK